MNNITETEQERQYRKNKNEIVGMIFLNICPVYAGKIDKISIRSSLRMPRSRKVQSIEMIVPYGKTSILKKSFLVLQVAQTFHYLRFVSFQFQSFII